jgi:hypothetical protein
MKKEWADKWVAALRSGEYQQARLALKRIDRSTDENKESFCCLGVLCDLAKDDNLIRGHWSGQQFISTSGAEVSCLPAAVKDAVGMKTEVGILTRNGDDQVALATLNDDGVPFSEIATLIEKHWEQL